MKKKIISLISVMSILTSLFAASPTYIVSYLKNGKAPDAVKINDSVTITVVFNEAISLATTPKIALVNASGDASGMSPQNMIRVDNTTFTLFWSVADGDGTLQPVVSIAKNMTNELVTNVGSTQTILTVDNITPALSNSTVGIKERYYGKLKVTDTLKFNFSEKLQLLTGSLQQAVSLHLGGKQGVAVPFTATFSNSNKTITIKSSSNLNCYDGTNLYYIGFLDSSFVDVAGNVLPLTEIVFHPDSVDVKPEITIVSSGSDKSKTCPHDQLTCVNPNTNLVYQWKLNNDDLSGESQTQFVVPLAQNGNYTLHVTNATTTCENESSVKYIEVYPTQVPNIVEKAEKDVVDVLVVDNSSDLYVAYEWTKADGSAVADGIKNNRQFLTLPSSAVNGSYKVITTDIYGCKMASVTKELSFKSYVEVYPTSNNGNFHVAMSSSDLGSTVIRVFSITGDLIYQSEFSKDQANSDWEINIPNTNTGTYILETTIADHVDVKQFNIHK